MANAIAVGDVPNLVDRDFPDGSSQSPTMVAQLDPTAKSTLNWHDRPWLALYRADFAIEILARWPFSAMSA